MGGRDKEFVSMNVFGILVFKEFIRNNQIKVNYITGEIYQCVVTGLD